MGLTAEAHAVMSRLCDRYTANGLPTPWTWLIARDDFQGTVDELIEAGLVVQKAGTQATYHLSEEGRRWALGQRGLVGGVLPEVQHGRGSSEGPLPRSSTVSRLRRRLARGHDRRAVCPEVRLGARSKLSVGSWK